MTPIARPDNARNEPPMRSPAKPNRLASPTRQDKVAREVSELQTAWEESMKGVGGIGLPHRQTAVLLISWENQLDDLHTGAEVDALEAVFTDLFRYTVVKKQLVAGKHEPQLQVNKILIDFVYEFDDENTLFIVYYAGHGMRGKKDKEGLVLAGKRKPNQQTNARNSVVWHEAELIIKRTKADVLVIFDCCYAGSLAKRPRSLSDRNFEFLAACGSDDLTDMPGHSSFTSALIWALTLLVKSKSSFTTQELLRKVNEEAPDFPEYQHALLMERGEEDTRCFRKLVLAPLPKPGETDEREIAPKNEKNNNQIKHYLDLRFFYDKPPNKEELLNLSQSLKGMIADGTISARHVGWLKMTDIVRKSIDQWRRMTVKQKQSPFAQNLTTEPDALSPQELNSPFTPITPPPSDSGANDTSVERTPEAAVMNSVQTATVNNLEEAVVNNVETVTISNLENLNLSTGDISTARLRRLGIGSPDYLLKIFIVGLIVLLLECFHRLLPREAPAIVLLTFTAYAWRMTSLYAKTAPQGAFTWALGYFPFLVGGISLFICSRLLLVDHGAIT